MSQDVDLMPTSTGRHLDPAMPCDAMRRPHRQHRPGRHVAPAPTITLPAPPLTQPFALLLAPSRPARRPLQVLDAMLDGRRP